MTLSNAAVEGISANGLKCRRSLGLNVPKDIPSLFEEKGETYYDRVKLAHDIATGIIPDLNKEIESLEDGSEKEELERIKEQMYDSLTYDNIEALKDWSPEDMVWVSEGVDEELLYQLHELYDWADYYRVCITCHD